MDKSCEPPEDDSCRLLSGDEEREEGEAVVSGSDPETVSSTSSQSGESHCDIMVSRRTLLCSSIRQFWFTQEAVRLTKLGVPIVLMLFFQQLIFFINLILVGHITGHSLELDAVALASSFINVTGISVIQGVASAADTLCSQAYGLGNYKRVGIVLQRGILILTIVMFPITIVWLNTESILIGLQQCPEVVRLASFYVRILITTLPFIMLLTLLQSYLRSQSIVWVFVVIGLVTTVISTALDAVVIFPAKLGLTGSAITVAVANIIPPLMLLAYMKVRGLHRLTWGGWSWESLREWGQFLKLGIPGLVMLCCEWWSFEIGMLVLGSINETQLAIYSIELNILINLFMVPLGLGIAAGVRVGNELGAGQPLRAKRAAYTVIIIMATVALFFSVTFLGLRTEIAKMFTQDEAVIEGVSMVTFIVAPLVFIDHVQGVIAGVLRGMGHQALAAVINFFSYYVVGLPVGITLALATNLDAFGVWIGLFIAEIIQIIGYSIIIFRTNWEKQSQKAVRNSKDFSISEHSSVDKLEDSLADQSSSELVSQQVAPSSTDEMTSSTQEETLLEETSLNDFINGVDSNSNGVLHRGGYEEVPLVSFQDSEIPSSDSKCTGKDHFKSNIKLLLFRSSFFVAGGILVVAGGVASHFHPDGDPSKCRSAYDNFTNSTEVTDCLTEACYNESYLQ